MSLPPDAKRRFLTRLGVAKLWREDPEVAWPTVLHHVFAPITYWLSPSRGYGAERVPAAGGGVIAANHLSAIDPPLVGMLCPRTIYYMAKVELLAMPVIGEALMWTGAFPVRRGEGDRDSVRLARDLVREGHMVGIFLEGTRQPFGYPGELRPGAFMIALHENVPVVPCGVYSFGWTRKNRKPCCIVWGDPIDLSGLPRSGKGYGEAATIVGAEVTRLWRLAGEAIVAGFPETLPDGARRLAPSELWRTNDAGVRTAEPWWWSRRRTVAS